MEFEIDKSTLIEGFVDENKQRLVIIDEMLHKIGDNFDDETSLQVLLRQLHTVKGSSRMLGFNVIEELSHAAEDIFKAFRDKKIQLNKKILELVFLCVNKISFCIDSVHSDGDDKVLEISSFVDVLNKASNGEDFDLEPFLQEAQKIISSEEEQSNEKNIADINSIKSIRIDLDAINNLIQEIDSLIIRQFQFKTKLSRMLELNKSLHSELLENYISDLNKDYEQQENDLFALQRDSFDLRMLPLNIVLAPLKQNIEIEAINSGKKVKFEIPETDITVDKNILVTIKEVLIHLVRNSLSHGIELPLERVQNGKSETGKISVLVHSQSNKIVISISDDGKGIDFDAIRQKALELYPLDAKNISQMDDNQLESFLYMPGFSTKKQADAISGRGVGLDIVKNNIEKIKGQLHLETKKGEGTTFFLTFPLTLASLHGLFARIGKYKIFVPTNYIAFVEHVNPCSYVDVDGKKMLNTRGEMIPVYYLALLMNQESDSGNNSARTDSVIVFDYLSRRMAFVVSEIFISYNLITSPLPPIFKNFTMLQGIVFDEEYNIVPIVNVPKIMEIFVALNMFSVYNIDNDSNKIKENILVVDDSITARALEESILTHENFIVETAENGMDAMIKINNRHFDLIVTDLEMPKMSGIDLITTLKQNLDFANIPIVVVSSVYESAIHDKVMKLGANDYIIKGDFERGNLVKVVKKLLNKTEN